MIWADFKLCARWLRGQKTVREQRCINVFQKPHDTLLLDIFSRNFRVALIFARRVANQDKTKLRFGIPSTPVRAR
jgi:hypothetical protein